MEGNVTSVLLPLSWTDTPAAECLLGTLENKDHVVMRTPLLSTATPRRPWSSSHSNLKPLLNGCTSSSPSWFPEGDYQQQPLCPGAWGCSLLSTKTRPTHPEVEQLDTWSAPVPVPLLAEQGTTGGLASLMHFPARVPWPPGLPPARAPSCCSVGSCRPTGQISIPPAARLSGGLKIPLLRPRPREAGLLN